MPLWVLYELGIVVAALISKPQPEIEPDYVPMSESDMDAEFDRIESSQAESEPRDPK
jgi:sec-independent protein translocase protein TatC